jgi:large subunit ribosomal protein L5
LNIGIKEHLFFPEISPEKSKIPFGLEITITTTAKTREEGLELLLQLGFPFILDDK